MAHVRARVGPDDEALARHVLPPSAWPLFAGMPVADRRHALDVAWRLVRSGNDQPALLVAALLHDVAKGDRMRLWHRVTGVLLEATAPAVLQRLALANRGSWRYPFWLYLNHAELSAGIAEHAGCDATTVRLIRGNPSGPDESAMLTALTAADDAS